MTERNVPFEVVDLDYKQTNDLIKLLTDIRFKLLAFFPPLVTVGVGLISVKGAAELGAIQVVGVGLLGFALTLGVILYDLRNSQLYDALVHRAKVLESILGCVGSGLETAVRGPRGRPAHRPARRAERDNERDLANPGGPHTQRPPSILRFLLFDVNHGTALALVYAALLGAWMFPIVSGLAAWLGSHFPATFGTRPTIPSRNFQFQQASWGFVLAASLAPLFAAIVATVVFFQLLRAADLPSAVTYLGYRHPTPAGWTNRFIDEAQLAHRKAVLERFGRSRAAAKLPQTYGLKSGRIRRRTLVRVLDNLPSEKEVRLCGGTVKVLGTYVTGSRLWRLFQFVPDTPPSSTAPPPIVRLARRTRHGSPPWVVSGPLPTSETDLDKMVSSRLGSPDDLRSLPEADEKQMIARGWR